MLQGDALALLPAERAASFDLAFVDPPYHLSNGGTTCRNGRRAPVRKGAWDRSLGLSSDLTFHRAWLLQVQRVLKPSGTLWVSGTSHSIFLCGFALQEMGWTVLNTVTWFKPNAAPNLSCRTFAHSSELLIWAAPPRVGKKLLHRFDYRGMKRENGGKQMRDLWPLPGPSSTWAIPTTPAAEKRHGGHPTQKPEALLERIIRCSTRKGAVVLDPFCGSGTTAVVAARLGRSYCAIDRDERWTDLTNRRIDEVWFRAGERAAAEIAAGFAGKARRTVPLRRVG